MKILKSAIVSNSDIIKNYKTLRDRTESLGKIFVFKNNQLDAVLFSISEYEKFSDILEEIESLDEDSKLAVLDFVRRKKAELLLPADFVATQK